MTQKWGVAEWRYPTTASPAESEAGFSLVEIVVAIFVLAGLSLSLIPVLVSGIRQTASNSVLALATHVVSTRMESAQVQLPTCEAVMAFAASAVPEIQTISGATLRVQQVLDACPSQYPGTVRLKVAVVRTDTGVEVSRATTLLYLKSAN